MAAWTGTVGQLYTLSSLVTTGLPVYCPYSRKEFKTLDYHHESDGTENTEVARYMLRQSGLNRDRIITGRSVINQCIKKLWAELNRVVLYH